MNNAAKLPILLLILSSTEEILRMPPAYDPPYARRQLLELFKSPPRVSFEAQDAAHIEHRFPTLNRPTAVLERRRRRFEIGRSGIPVIDPDAFPNSLNNLRESFEFAAGKFKYGKTSTREWETHFRYSDDRLVRTHRAYAIEPSATKQSSPINRSANALRTWFESVLSTIAASHATQRLLILGDPGAGKSTMLKFMITSNWEQLQKERVIFSRFEFMKFMREWYRGPETLAVDLEHYLSLLVLRDIICLSSFDLVDCSAFRRKFRAPFSNAITLRQLRQDFELRFPTVAANGAEVEQFFKGIENAVRDDGVDVLRLRHTNATYRVLLAQYFCETYKLCVVFDGLDHIAVEDKFFRTDRVSTLKYIRKNFGRLTSFENLSPDRAPLATCEIHIMRENTYFHGIRDQAIDVPDSEMQVYYVQSLDMRVVLFNMVRRAVGRWCQVEGQPPEIISPLANALMGAVETAMKAFHGAIGASRLSGVGYSLFEGNIRRVFQFVGKLLEWFVAAAVKEGKITVGSDTSLRKVVEILTGLDGFGILMRRNYRLVEQFLFTDLPWFENAIAIEERDPFDTYIQAHEGERFSVRDNTAHSGFVDNVFNYQTWRHANHGDSHCLLEKVRILQLLKGCELTSRDLEATLEGKFGYRCADLNLVLAIMIRNQLITIKARQNSPSLLTATSKGACTLDFLLHNMTYVEHVFHQTYLPNLLLTNKADERREIGTYEWTVNSIRNTFCFLTYLRYVEDHNARGRSVPDVFRIYPRIQSSICTTLERILRRDERDRAPGSESIASGPTLTFASHGLRRRERGLGLRSRRRVWGCRCSPRRSG